MIVKKKLIVVLETKYDGKISSQYKSILSYNQVPNRKLLELISSFHLNNYPLIVFIICLIQR